MNKKKENVFRILARWFVRFFMGAKYEEKMYKKGKTIVPDEENKSVPNDSELIVSPAKQAFQGFISNKFAVFAFFAWLFIFAFVFIAPHFMPKYFDAYTEVTLKNLPPNLTMMKVPAELKNDIKMIDSYGPFSVGLSNAGKVYVWGCKKLGASGMDVEIPEEYKDIKMAMVAAGVDHIVAIGEDGKIYAWGSDRFGQYGRSENAINSATIEAMPEELYENGVDVDHVKQLTCGYQATAILMDDGTVELTEYSGNETVINIPSKIDGKNVTKVDNEVLVRSNITEINLPDTVYKNIDDILFYRDPELKAINVSEKNKYISSVDGVLFNKDKTVLYSFPRQKEDKEYTIPNGVKAIGQHAFCHAKNIEKVTLSSSVREIGAYAFEDSGLKEIKLNNKLKTIRKGAFSLARLAEIYIPESVKKMGNRMFGDSNRYIKIYGYKNSAAQKIAKKYNYKFYIVDPAAPKKTTVRGAKGKIKVN